MREHCHTLLLTCHIARVLPYFASDLLCHNTTPSMPSVYYKGRSIHCRSSSRRTGWILGATLILECNKLDRHRSLKPLLPFLQHPSLQRGRRLAKLLTTVFGLCLLGVSLSVHKAVCYGSVQSVAQDIIRPHQTYDFADLTFIV